MCHRPGPFRDLGCSELRGGHDQDLGVRDLLPQTHRDISRSRGEIEKQEIHVTPEDIGQQLGESPVQDGATPCHNLIPGRFQHAHRDHLQPLGCRDRQNHVVDDRRTCITQTQEIRHGVAVDVGIEDGDAATRFREGQGQVHRDRGLTDTALAGSDRDHLRQVSRPGERDLAFRLATAQHLPHRGSLFLIHHTELDVHALDTLDGFHGLGHTAGYLGAHRASGNGQQNPNEDLAIVSGRQFIDHAQFRDRAVNFGILNRVQSSSDQRKKGVLVRHPSILPHSSAGFQPFLLGAGGQGVSQQDHADTRQSW